MINKEDILIEVKNFDNNGDKICLFQSVDD